MTLGKLSRRTLLRGLGAAGIVLPTLPSLRGEAAGFPKRLVVVFSANGTIRSSWNPSGSETSFTLSPILKPLDPYKKDLIILEGVDLASTNSGPGDGHMKGMGHLLTATDLLSGTQFKCGGKTPCSGWGGGISVDQFIAKKINSKCKYDSLEFGVQVKSATVWSRMCYSGANQPVPPEDSPYKMFNRLFANLGKNNTAQLDALRKARKSVLDAVTADLAALKSAAGSADRKRLEAHLSGIRSIEKRLDGTSNPLGAACQKPTMGSTLDINKNDNYPAIGKLQMDLLAMALACNLTQVASLQWSRSVSNVVHKWVSVNTGHHTLSHDADSSSSAKSALIKINNWYAKQFAYLLKQLSAVSEGSGTLLDNTVVVWGNELGNGDDHSRKDVPFVLAGGCGGYFKTGRFLKYSNTQPHNDLLVSLCNAMGVNVSTFGNAKYCNGPLKGLRS